MGTKRAVRDVPVLEETRGRGAGMSGSPEYRVSQLCTPGGEPLGWGVIGPGGLVYSCQSEKAATIAARWANNAEAHRTERLATVRAAEQLPEVFDSPLIVDSPP